MNPPRARWVEVADGVLARRHHELDLTTGLVLGDSAALVVDTGGDHVQGAALAAAVRQVTALPLLVVITHAHFDHCFGTGAFDGAPVYAHPACTAAIRATAEAQRSEWTAHYRERGDPATAAALATTVVVPPDRVAPAHLELGGREVALLHLGRGHTDHDVAVHVADVSVLFTGDLVEQGAPPSVGPDSHPGEWPDTLDALLKTGAHAFVPGHGDPVDQDFVAAQRRALTPSPGGVG